MKHTDLKRNGTRAVFLKRVGLMVVIFLQVTLGERDNWQ